MRTPRVRTFKKREHSPTIRSLGEWRPARLVTRKEQTMSLGVGVGRAGMKNRQEWY